MDIDEIKGYLRVDHNDDDSLIYGLMSAAQRLCLDILRQDKDDIEIFVDDPRFQMAIYYAVAYLYEHREDADNHELTMSLRSLLFGLRKEEF